MIVRTGIPPACRNQAAALYWEAFGTKLQLPLGPDPRALTFINRVMALDHGICALDEDGDLLGVVGFKTPQGALVGGNYHDLRKVYGWVSAMVRITILAALERDVENRCFLVDGIFVAPAARGRGIGTALLHAAFAEATRRGYHHVRLDVIDTNQRARALYQREGFEPVKTMHIGWRRLIFGFRSATAMVRPLT